MLTYFGNTPCLAVQVEKYVCGVLNEAKQDLSRQMQYMDQETLKFFSQNLKSQRGKNTLKLYLVKNGCPIRATTVLPKQCLSPYQPHLQSRKMYCLKISVHVPPKALWARSQGTSKAMLMPGKSRSGESCRIPWQSDGFGLRACAKHSKSRRNLSRVLGMDFLSISSAVNTFRKSMDWIKHCLIQVETIRSSLGKGQ